MSRKLLFGDLPVILYGINKGRLDRNKTALKFNLSKDEIYKAYNNWIQIFRKENSSLTFEEYLTKMREVDISPNQIGNGIFDYQLCRNNDEGGYHNFNCKFKLKSENLDEQVKIIPYINMLNKYGIEKTKELLSQYGKMAWLE